jgi:hypothetical protein
MIRSLAIALLAAAPLVPASAQVGRVPPEMKVVKWYNTPPLALEQLAGKGVLIEVFRTW